MVVNVFKLHMSVNGFRLVQSSVKNAIILFIFIFLSMTSPARNARVMFFKARNFLMRFFKIVVTCYLLSSLITKASKPSEK